MRSFKPQNKQVQLDWSNPFVKLLSCAYVLTPSQWTTNLVNGRTGGSQVGAGVTFPEGWLRTNGVVGDGALLDHGLALNIALPLTFIVGCRKISGNITWSILQDTGNWFGWFSENTGELRVTENNGFDGTVTMGGTGSMAVTHASSTSAYGSSNAGSGSDSAITTPTGVTRSQVTLGFARRNLNDNPAVAEFTHFCAIQGALTADQLKSLAENPEQLFTYGSRPAWLRASLVGTTYTSAITEVVTAGESSLPVLIATATITEAVVSSESGAAVLTLTATISEVVTAGESAVPALIVTATITEVVTAGESADATIPGGATTYNVTIVEVVATGESATTSVVMTLTSNEALTLLDSPAASNNMTAAISEAATSGESSVPVLVMPSVISETVASADSQTAAAIFAAAILELVVTSEVGATNMNANVTISESIFADDPSVATGGTASAILIFIKNNQRRRVS